jgi:hypothetical protein
MQAERLDGMAQITWRLGIARINDAQPDQAVFVPAHQARQVCIGTPERVGIIQAIAVTEEGRQEHTHIHARVIQCAQHIVCGFLAGAMKVRVDQHVLNPR